MKPLFGQCLEVAGSIAPDDIVEPGTTESAPRTPSYLTKLRYDARASMSLGESLPAMRGIGGLAAT